MRGGASSLQSGGILLCSLREEVVRSWCLVSLSLSVHKPPALGVLLGAHPFTCWSLLRSACLSGGLTELKVCNYSGSRTSGVAFFSSRCAGILPPKLPSKDGSLVSFVSLLVSK